MADAGGMFGQLAQEIAREFLRSDVTNLGQLLGVQDADLATMLRDLADELAGTPPG